MPGIRFDRFYRYDDLTAILQGWASDHPDLFRLESIGASHEGRDIWLCTVTKFDTGPAEEKPALWIEASIHATELTGTVAATYLLNRLITSYGSDSRVTTALDTRVFYVVPRVNPDGAELALADDPGRPRSSVRPYPWVDQQDGLVEHDVDGDGRILFMRIPDPNGTWKVAAEDARLMVPRDPFDTEDEGPFYRVLSEGTIQNWDGVTIKAAPPLWGLDMNRNFPMEWAPEGKQYGAGPFPSSEPEIRAEMEAVVARPNITGSLHYHTFSGVHLRPYSAHPDEDFPTNDLRTYRLIGQRGTELTGYPAVSVFHDFKYDLKDTISGAADDWMYDHRGVYAWTTEFWSPMRTAGITDYHLIEWMRDHPLSDDLKLLEWVDANLAPGEGFIPWYPFDHQQFGAVELGGVDFLHYFGNPPPAFLEKEVAPHSDFALFHLLISPLLRFRDVSATAVGDGAWRVRAVVENTGWLPTSVTEKAVERKVVRPLTLEVSLPDGASVASGEVKVECGQLTGRALRRSLIWWGGDDTTSDRAKVEWVIEAPAGSEVTVTAGHERAGTVRQTVRLQAT
jgi:murein tripeptide amidase MpaA